MLQLQVSIVCCPCYHLRAQQIFMLQDDVSTFCNMKICCGEVVIRALLRGRLKENVARITWPLTLFLPTSQMCVENTVLAFMICLLFNLSYKVTITCKWNQLVYFAIITANKPNQPPDFHCISPVRFGNKAQNAKFSAKEQHQKLHISIVYF